MDSSIISDEADESVASGSEVFLDSVLDSSIMPDEADEPVAVACGEKPADVDRSDLSSKDADEPHCLPNFDLCGSQLRERPRRAVLSK